MLAAIGWKIGISLLVNLGDAVGGESATNEKFFSRSRNATLNDPLTTDDNTSSYVTLPPQPLMRTHASSPLRPLGLHLLLQHPPRAPRLPTRVRRLRIASTILPLPLLLLLLRGRSRTIRARRPPLTLSLSVRRLKGRRNALRRLLLLLVVARILILS